MLALALASAMALQSTFNLTEPQREATEVEMRSPAPPRHFSTASEAAYAAALTYGKTILFFEVGAKVYVDNVASGPRYSFGPELYGQIDPATDAPEITYPTDQTDGHTAIVGLWHEHPTGDSSDTLFGHDADVRNNKQAVWTSVGMQFFVQYWDGTNVVPQWTAETEIPALCSACVV